jgi:hypothetical protein
VVALLTSAAGATAKSAAFRSEPGAAQLQRAGDERERRAGLAQPRPWRPHAKPIPLGMRVATVSPRKVRPRASWPVSESRSAAFQSPSTSRTRRSTPAQYHLPPHDGDAAWGSHDDRAGADRGCRGPMARRGLLRARIVQSVEGSEATLDAPSPIFGAIRGLTRRVGRRMGHGVRAGRPGHRPADPMGARGPLPARTRRLHGELETIVRPGL